ncbi:hypothetical protein EST38_g8139 [Candolleomyces aberdarensis]|uniref:Uncharacterized protein n=1 Tax=Candolleomyces aberdarensis TaxID=2316362 RepID=A0A4Q2DFK0_9AGAR|nr:hypothetical protein EST38_g8139 [Candolleomyces aberdarensis]
MASKGKNWASKDQGTWLKARMNKYEACIPTRKYESFWKTLYADWQMEFPMMEELFSGRKFESLSNNEKEQFKDAWAFRRRQLKAWYRWRFNPRNRSIKKKVGNSVLNKLYNRNRKKRIFAKFAFMYPEVVKGPISKAYKEEGVNKRKCLPVWTKVVKQLWDDATVEQRTRVNEALMEDRRAEEEPKSPEEIQQLQFGEPEDAPTLVTYWRDYDHIYGEKVAEYYAEHVQGDSALEEGMAEASSESSDDDDDDDDDDGDGDGDGDDSDGDLPNSNILSDSPIPSVEGSNANSNTNQHILPGATPSNPNITSLQQSGIPIIDASQLQYDFLPADPSQNLAMMVLPHSNANSAATGIGGAMHGGGIIPQSNWALTHQGSGFDSAGGMGGAQQDFANFARDFGSSAYDDGFSGANYASHLQHPSLGNMNHPALVVFPNTNSYVNTPPRDIYPNGHTDYWTIDYDPYNLEVLNSMNETNPLAAPVSSTVTILGGPAPVSSNVNINSGPGPISSTVSINSGKGPITSTVSIGRSHRARFAPASGHMKEMELGEEFNAIREKWEELEKLLDYGKLSKGTLPNAVGHPSKWKSWISRTRNGQRDYTHAPSISLSDTPEFGLAIIKYWHSIQPAFRQNPNGIWPLPIYSSPDAGSDPWELLRKGGPNGLVSIVTMLAWWGCGTRKIPVIVMIHVQFGRRQWPILIAVLTRCWPAARCV